MIKTKIRSKEGKKDAYHSMTHPNNIRRKEGGSSLITNTKPQISKFWVSFREDKESLCKWNMKCEDLGNNL